MKSDESSEDVEGQTMNYTLDRGVVGTGKAGEEKEGKNDKISDESDMSRIDETYNQMEMER